MKLYTNEQYIVSGNSIGVFKHETSLAEVIHRHEFIEIIYFTKGEARHIVDGVAYDVKRGDVLFINYGSTHSYQPKESLSYINISFSPEAVGSSLITPENAFALLSLSAFNEMRGSDDVGKISFIGSERAEIESIVNAMVAEQNEKKPYSDAVMQSYMNILIVKMLRKVTVSQDELDGSLWQELSSYIDDNIDTKLTLEALAKKCFYNPSYFSRIFKEKFGVSFKEYIGRRRIDFAAQLLLDTELTVDDISRKAGFSDRSSFYQLFAKYKHTTPSEYRKTRKK